VNHAPEPRHEIPAPEALLSQITHALAEMRQRAANHDGHTPDPTAPVFVVIDETHDFDRFAQISPAWRHRVGEILERGRAVTVTGIRP
jgi:hypothetical protein